MKKPAQTGSTPVAPAISVAMATYNGEKYIQEQLESLARQTLLPLELVVTDDGSTDATLDIIGAFARTAPFPVRVFRNEARLGFADNFLKCSSLCQGHLIAFCDQDDIWVDQKLKRCLEFFDNPEVMLVVHSAQTFRGSSERGDFHPRFTQTAISGRGVCDPFIVQPGFAMIFRREILSLADHDGRPLRLCNHDLWVWFLAAIAGRIVTCEDVLALYRQHDRNLYGAPEPRVNPRGFRRFADFANYEELSERELLCSRLLAGAIDRAPDRWKATLKVSVGRFERRSRFLKLRGRIYSASTGLSRRAFAFCKILISGGYLPDLSRCRPGIRGALKDLTVGVCRVGYLPRERAQVNFP